MRVRYHGLSGITTLIDGKEYEVIGIEEGLYRVIDEEGYDEDEEVQGYLYSPSNFEIVSGGEYEFSNRSNALPDDVKTKGADK